MTHNDDRQLDLFKDPEPEKVEILEDLPLKPGQAAYANPRTEDGDKKKILLFPFLLLVILFLVVCAVFAYFYVSQNKKFTEKLARANMLISTQEQAFAELESELARTQQAGMEKDDALEKLRSRYDESKRSNIIRESRLESSLKKTKNEAEELKETQKKTISELGETRDEASKWQTVAKEDDQLRTRLLQKIEDLKSALNKNEAKMVQLTNELNEEINNNARLRSQVSTLKSEKNKLMNEIRRLEADINALINTPPPEQS